MPEIKRKNLIRDWQFRRVLFAFFDLMDGKKDHDISASIGCTEERAKEIADLRQKMFDMYGKSWLNSK